MANDEHVSMLKLGVDAWNSWRHTNPDVVPDLMGADLRHAELGHANLAWTLLLGARLVKANLSSANLSGSMLNGAQLSEAQLGGTDLSGANLWGADLTGADLTGADLKQASLTQTDLTRAILTKANLKGAHLQQAILDGVNLGGLYLAEWDLSKASFRGADFTGSSLVKAKLRGANLSGANLVGVNLGGADLSRANLAGAKLIGASLLQADLSQASLVGADLQAADLRRASMLETNLANADLTGCRVYGISAWNLALERTKQQNLVITPHDEPEITVDNIEVAQFIYLMLNNQKVRDVIDTITSKVVLILGRFTPERKQVLDGLRNELRKRNYLPVMFDFEKATTQTTDETITLLARMARFVVADLSDAKSILQELRGIVPDLPSVAVQPLILIPQEEPGMFDFIRRYPWVLEPYRYHSQKHLLANLEKSVVDPAEAKARELRGLPSTVV
jgi:uncharacterized protein YjbI with pentapeptide repeats